MRCNSKAMVLAAAVLVVASCDDVLTVDDPERFTSDDVDQALEAAANGVEGNINSIVDNMAIQSALLSDEYQHTGTWAGYDDVDHGRIRWGTDQNGNNFQNLVATRWFAGDTEERLIRVLGESEANETEMMAQVQTMGAVADLLLGMYWCEGPAEPSGPAVTDMELLAQAAQKFTRSLETARAMGSKKWEMISLAGRARANLLINNLAEAAQDASAVPDGWVHAAIYSEARQDNSLVSLTTQGFNTAAGLREKWWPMVDTDEGAIRDPWTNEADRRMPVLYTGEFGVDGVTPHYSQWRFRTRGADIPIFHSAEMRLIEAEAAIRTGNIAQGLAIMNALRTDAGLDALPDTNDEARAMEYLLHERFAEMFFQGMRMVDLWRFDLTDSLVQAGAFLGTQDPRPVKFPMSDAEANDNPNIAREESAHCLPMSR